MRIENAQTNYWWLVYSFTGMLFVIYDCKVSLGGVNCHLCLLRFLTFQKRWVVIVTYAFSWFVHAHIFLDSRVTVPSLLVIMPSMLVLTFWNFKMFHCKLGSPQLKQNLISSITILCTSCKPVVKQLRDHTFMTSKWKEGWRKRRGYVFVDYIAFKQ